MINRVKMRWGGVGGSLKLDLGMGLFRMGTDSLSSRASNSMVGLAGAVHRGILAAAVCVCIVGSAMYA